MSIKFTREKLKPYIGKSVQIQYNLGRNKFEKYSGKIIELYPNIFLFQEENGFIRCFSYSDVLTKTIRLLEIS